MVSFVLAPLGIITFSFLLLSFFFSLVKSLHVIMYKVLKPKKLLKKEEENWPVVSCELQSLIDKHINHLITKQAPSALD